MPTNMVFHHQQEHSIHYCSTKKGTPYTMCMPPPASLSEESDLKNDVSQISGSEFDQNWHYFSESMPVPFTVWIVMLGILGSMGCIGTLGNLLIFGAVYVEKTLRTTSSAFVLNLAASDLLVSAYIIPMALVNLLYGGRNPFGNGICKFTGYVGQVSCNASTFNLALIAVNRYSFIVKFSYYSTVFTSRNTIKIIVAIWTVAASIAAPNLLGWGNIRFDQKTMICSFDRTYSFSYTCFLLLTAVAVPINTTLFCYYRIFSKVRRSRQKFAAVRKEQQKALARTSGKLSKTKTQRERKARKDQLKLIQSLFIVFIAFNVCWMPYMLTVMLDYKDNLSHWVHLGVMWLVLANSCMNSFIYGVMNRNFRAGYRKIVFRWKFNLGSHSSST